MKNTLTAVGRKYARQQSAFMVAVVLLVTLVIYFVWGWSIAKSALLGGFIAIIPNMLFAYKAFKYAGAQASEKVIDSFFSGVKLKMALTALLLALSFKFLVLVPLPFFSMFSLVLMLPAVTPYIFKN
ncbi:ATP synthase subunit I [Colwellia sp. TT2012]|uniref:ATP synthase subunit I n=1 Tax=Colwellia sp. TT2012 TaxID=1720342 RepID=UPI0009EB2FD1|nr:ATP synthase subunit I [Colwellia sp. TT2012]